MLEMQQNYLPRSLLIAKCRFLCVENVNPQSWFNLIQKSNINIAIGTLAQEFEVAVDTTSHALFVPSTTCHCGVCDPR